VVNSWGANRASPTEYYCVSQFYGYSVTGNQHSLVSVSTGRVTRHAG